MTTDISFYLWIDAAAWLNVLSNQDDERL